MKAKSDTLFIGTKFIGHDSSFFIVDPDKQEIFAMSTERITRYKHDHLSPDDVLRRYVRNNRARAKEIKKLVIGHSFSSVGLSLTKDYYSFHSNFRKHF